MIRIFTSPKPPIPRRGDALTNTQARKPFSEDSPAGGWGLQLPTSLRGILSFSLSPALFSVLTAKVELLQLKPGFREGLTPPGQGLGKKTQLLEGKTSLTAPFNLSQGGFASSLTNTKHLREAQSNSWVCFGQEMPNIGMSRIGRAHIKARETGPSGVCPPSIPSTPAASPGGVALPWLAPGAKDEGFG